MRQAIKRKLRGRSGESIAETLIAVLIAAVALMMLAGMLSATTNTVQRSSAALESYYAENENLETLTPVEGKTEIVTVTVGDSEGNWFSKSVTVYKNTSLGDGDRAVRAYAQRKLMLQVIRAL